MDDPTDLEWRLIRERGRPGAMQMALDEVAAGTAAEGGPATVRVYRWSPGTLSLGYGQRPETVDWDYCEREGIDVTRRRTGGGGIYHDVVGEISYAIAAPAAALPDAPRETYRLLLEPVLRAFEWLDVPAALAETERAGPYEPACYLRGIDPAHDVVVPADAGPAEAVRKVSGTAQYRRREAVLQHGSVLFSARPERHLAVFDDPGVPPAEFRERVTGIDDHTSATRNAAVRAFERSLAGWADAYDGSWSAAELDRARELVESTYGAGAWVREREA